MDKYDLYLFKRYENYKSVLFSAASIPRLQSPKEIEFEMMEQLDVDIPCYITAELMDLLCEKNIIYEEIKMLSLELREEFIEYSNDVNSWNVTSFIHSDMWRKWYIKANDIYELLYF